MEAEATYPGVTFDKRTQKYFGQVQRKKEHHKTKDYDTAREAHEALQALCEANGVAMPKPRNHTKAEYTGVHRMKKKWVGQVYDKLESKGKYTTVYPTAEQAHRARLVLQKRLDAKFEAEMQRRIARAGLAQLPRAPEKVADAEAGVVYCHVAKQSNYQPHRVLRSGNYYQPACAECDQFAMAPGTGQPATHCKRHGGGKRCIGVNGCCPIGIAVQMGKADIYDGRCVRCFIDTNPDDPRAKAAKNYLHAKELTVREFLESVFPEYKWTFDKSMNVSGYRLRFVGTRRQFRPDAMAKRGRRIIVVEIDEHSHRGYECAKEREREQYIVDANRGYKVVLVRFNPDEYTDYGGKRWPSCFSPPTKVEGKVHVNKTQQKQWQQRLEALSACIDTLLDRDFVVPPPEEGRPLFSVELFYDDVARSPEEERQKHRDKFKAIQNERKKREAERASALGKRKACWDSDSDSD